MKRTMALGIALGLAATAAHAEEFADNVYVGGGLGLNSISGWDDATGFQVFGGYHLDMLKLDPFNFAVEIGYFDSGSFEQEVVVFGQSVRAESDASGLWANAVATFPLNEQFHLVGRAGLDFGDDDGPMLGVGAGYSVNQQFNLRAEYVMRDNIDSLQANVTFDF